MRPKRPYPTTIKRDARVTLYLPKPLRTIGYGGALLLTVLGNLPADEPSDVPASSTPSLIDSSPGAVASPQMPDDTQPLAPYGTPQTQYNTQNSNNQQNPDNTQQQPNNGQTLINPTPTTPLLPQQAINPYLPFSSNYSATGNQPPQVTAPNLYTVGTYNVSQIATTSALSQAFTEGGGAGGFDNEPGMTYSHPPIERIRIGPLDLKAALATNVVNDDNVNGGGGNGSGGSGKVNDTSYGITPAILVEYGAHEGQRGMATLVYSPTFTRYLRHPGFNTDNENVALSGEYPFQRLTLNVSESYSQSTGINSDTNSRTTQTAEVTTAGGTYVIDDKLTFSGNYQYVKTSYSNPANQNGGGTAGQGDETSSINTSLSYQLSDKMSIGPSLNVGVDKPDGSNQETFEQALAGLTYQPTEKINLYVHGGVEIRQGSGSNGNSSSGGANGSTGDSTNPIFSAGVGYTPFDSTTLSLNAYQSVYSSTDVSSQNVTTTGVGVEATQRFFQRIFLGFSASYAHNETSGSGNNSIGTASGSSQDTYSLRPSLSYSPTLWSSLALYYQYLDNESDNSGANYRDHQVGLSATVQF